MWKAPRIPMTVNGTSTKEYFDIIKCIEDNTSFTMLLGKPWIERDQARQKEEEEALEQKKQELKYFMTRRIAHLIEEQENRSNLFITRNLNVEARITKAGSQTSAQISFPLQSKISWLCACRILTERNKEEESVEVTPGWG